MQTLCKKNVGQSEIYMDIFVTMGELQNLLCVSINCVDLFSPEWSLISPVQLVALPELNSRINRIAHVFHNERILCTNIIDGHQIQRT